MKDEHFILSMIYFPFVFVFLGALLPDPLYVLDISPDFGMTPDLFIVPNFFRIMFFGIFLNPFYIFLCLVVSYLVVTTKMEK